MDITALRLKAVEEALKLVKDGMLIGLGSGTTIRLFVEKLAERVRREGLEVYFVSTSYDTSFLASKLGLLERPLLEEKPAIAFDGADAVFPGKWVVKGIGGALFREKIVDYYSKEYVILVDEGKLKSTPSDVAVPLEVHPFSVSQVLAELRNFEGVKSATLRVADKGKIGPVVSDNGNFLVDAVFSDVLLPENLERELMTLPGVVANGVFAIKRPSRIYVGARDGVHIIQ
ncbi:ribose 5-phosphate isomerase A [Infirmifilum lucidum]|nr:ribose 5-phosphate isomerase A [Infirmifilum lucidum]